MLTPSDGCGQQLLCTGYRCSAVPQSGPLHTARRPNPVSEKATGVALPYRGVSGCAYRRVALGIRGFEILSWFRLLRVCVEK